MRKTIVIIYIFSLLLFCYNIYNMYTWMSFSIVPDIEFTEELQIIDNDAFRGINPSISYDYSSGVFWGLIRITNDHKCPGFRILKHYRSYLKYFEFKDHANRLTVKTPFVDYYNDITCQHATFDRNGLEDPRTITKDSKKYAVVGGLAKPSEPCRNDIGLLELDTGVLKRMLPDRGQSEMQKNWIPFLYDNEIFYEYSIDPHVIMKQINETHVTTLSSTVCSDMPFKLHGGAPAFHHKDHYIGLAHTLKTYKHVFYMFNDKPPWNLIAYSDTYTFKNRGIQFASGMVRIGDNVIISYSVNDCKTYVSKIRLESILGLIKYRC